MMGKGGRARNASSLPRGSGQAAGYNLNLHFGTIVAEIFSNITDAPFVASSIILPLNFAHESWPHAIKEQLVQLGISIYSLIH